MSSSIKRILYDLTNEKKRLKSDSAIDLNFNSGGLNQEKSQSSHSILISSESSINNDSIFDHDVFDEDESSVLSSSKIVHNQGRSRLNGTSTYPAKKNNHQRKLKCIKNETIMVNETLSQLREEQARIEAHSLSITTK